MMAIGLAGGFCIAGTANTGAKTGKKKAGTTVVKKKRMKRNGSAEEMSDSVLITEIRIVEDKELKDEMVAPKNEEEIISIDEKRDCPGTVRAYREAESCGKANNDYVFEMVEHKAEFPGGLQALMTWLGSNIRYPDDAVADSIQGRVIIRFVVEKDGEISGVEVLKGVYPSLDAEAIRVVREMPRWIPGKMGDTVVRSAYVLPISFRLTDSGTTKEE